MNLLTDLLTFVGFIAITFGVAGTISRWFKAAEERKRDAFENHRQVTAALARIEESIRHLKP
jgi:hypothetical protein